MSRINMMISKLAKKLELRWFAKHDQGYYNDDMRKALLECKWFMDEDIDDVMYLFENVFVGDDFDVQSIVKDFEACNDGDMYSNFLNNYDSIMDVVNDLGLKYN